MLVLAVLLFSSFEIQDRTIRKANKEIANFYQLDNIEKEAIIISEEIVSKVPSDFGALNFFKIRSQDEFLGYAYIGSAFGKAANFDYLILFDSQFIITKSKVLIYREEYGGEIGSKRWLKQFEGIASTSEELVYNEDIIPISGATISVRAMTNGINDLLKSIRILQELNQL